ncbi:MAG: methyltransferase small [Bacteroidetes bacterium]|nr:methyltransferase small [Bacteroidota bacterium]
MDFKTTQHNIRIGDRSYAILSVTNFDELYEQLLAKGLQHEEVADERIPYWAELWPSAVGLSEYLGANQNMLKGKTVLEIGGGLGLPALVAASLGAEVTATDYLQDAVDFSQKNAALNNVSNITFQTLDWRKPEGIAPFDILLASDVAYERRQFEPLLHAFKHLVKPGGLILLSEPNRYIAEPLIEELKRQGYELEKYNYDVEVREIKSKVSVYAITRSQ